MHNEQWILSRKNIAKASLHINKNLNFQYYILPALQSLFSAATRSCTNNLRLRKFLRKCLHCYHNADGSKIHARRKKFRVNIHNVSHQVLPSLFLYVSRGNFFYVYLIRRSFLKALTWNFNKRFSLRFLVLKIN